MLVLATASPRRKALLEKAGIDFLPRPVSVDEDPSSGLSPTEVAVELAVRKARAAVPDAGGQPVLSADTIVVLDGRILGKPGSAEHAVETLTALSGREHEVITGVCLVQGERERTRVVTTRVTFRHLTEKEIRDYVATGEPMDKAGAYGIQARAAKFVAKLDGSRSNVVGLPMETVAELLAEER